MYLPGKRNSTALGKHVGATDEVSPTSEWKSSFNYYRHLHWLPGYPACGSITLCCSLVRDGFQDSGKKAGTQQRDEGAAPPNGFHHGHHQPWETQRISASSNNNNKKKTILLSTQDTQKLLTHKKVNFKPQQCHPCLSLDYHLPSPELW